MCNLLGFSRFPTSVLAVVGFRQRGVLHEVVQAVKVYVSLALQCFGFDWLLLPHHLTNC
jgi:hypothetical protein